MKDKSRREIKIVECFNCQAKAFDLYALGNEKPWKFIFHPVEWLKLYKDFFKKNS